MKNVLFGLIDTFAIEMSSRHLAAIDSSTHNPDFIYFYYWIDGKKVGGGEVHTLELCSSMRYVDLDSTARHLPEFCAASSKAVFTALNAHIMQRPTALGQLASVIPGDFMKFSLWFHHILGSKQFFLIDCGAESRLIYGETDGKFQGHVVAPIENFVRPINEAYEYLKLLQSKI